jgi:glycosyltransferase involved in cell wall biosynthesis
VEFDAVSTSLLHKLEILQRLRILGYPVDCTVFTQGTDLDRPEMVVTSPGDLTRHPGFLTADLHIYEFGMHYELFDTHDALPPETRKLVIDHNTTPPELVGSDEARRHCADAISRRTQLAWADHVATVSEFTLQADIDAGLPTERLSVLHLPPACSTRPAIIGSQRISSRPGPVHFLFVGRFVRGKGIFELLDVVDDLIGRSDLQLRFTLVGSARFSEDDAVSRINRLVDKHGHDGTLRVISGIEARELEELYHSAHALVIPSYHEGYCVPVVEALWAGTLPITSDAANLPNVTGGLGFMVPVGDVDELTRALEIFAGRVLAARASGQLSVPTAKFGDVFEDSWRTAVFSHLSQYSFDTYTRSFIDLLTRLFRQRPQGAPEWILDDHGELAALLEGRFGVVSPLART